MKVNMTSQSTKVYTFEYSSINELLHAYAMSRVIIPDTLIIDLIGMATFSDLIFKDNSSVMTHILNANSFNGMCDTQRIKVMSLLHNSGVAIDYIKVAEYGGILLDHIFTMFPPCMYVDDDGYLLGTNTIEDDILTMMYNNCGDLCVVKKAVLNIAANFDVHKKGMMDLSYDTLVDILELTYKDNENAVMYVLKESITDLDGILECSCILDHLKCRIKNEKLLADITEYIHEKLHSDVIHEKLHSETLKFERSCHVNKSHKVIDVGLIIRDYRVRDPFEKR